MTFDEYMLQPDAERIMLIEFTRNDARNTRYFLSDSFYTTEPTDADPNVLYSATVSGQGLPQLRRQLNDLFSGNASTGFGTIEFAIREADFVKTGPDEKGVETMVLPRGTAVKVELVAPRSMYPRSDSILLLQGKVARTGGDSDGRFTVEITDGSNDFKQRELIVDQFPLGFGQVYNASPFPIDPATRTYAVHDGPIQAIDAVYDDGVQLGPFQYTVDLANGQFSLLLASAGIITVDFRGDNTGGYSASTEGVINRLLSRVGNTYATSFDVGLPTGAIGYYIQGTTTIGQALDELTEGFSGYWLVDRDATLKFGMYPLPSGLPSVVYTEDDLGLEGKVDYRDDDYLFSSVRYTYRPNWTPNQFTRIGASAAQADFARREALEGSVVDGAPIAEYEYYPSPVLKTYFVNISDAQTAANRILNLYRQPRIRLETTVPFNEALTIGQQVELNFSGATYFGAIVSVTDILDGNYPVQSIEVIS